MQNKQDQSFIEFLIKKEKKEFLKKKKWRRKEGKRGTI